jgi:hypothetical protein
MTEKTQLPPSADQQLATKLAKLWPHREHQAPSFAGFFCGLGLHRWRSLNVAELAPRKHVRFCFWCSLVKINTKIYTP